MLTTILAETAASLSELKNDPLAILAAGDSFPVAIFDHDEPAFYCIPAKAYEIMLEALEEVGLAYAIAKGRKNKFVSAEEIFSILGSNLSMPS